MRSVKTMTPARKVTTATGTHRIRGRLQDSVGKEPGTDLCQVLTGQNLHQGLAAGPLTTVTTNPNLFSYGRRGGGRRENMERSPLRLRQPNMCAHFISSTPSPPQSHPPMSTSHESAGATGEVTDLGSPVQSDICRGGTPRSGGSSPRPLS